MSENVKKFAVGVFAVVMIIGGIAPIAMAQDEAPAESGGVQKPLPISLSVEYTLVSDYVFRGVNFSEYSGEGRERCNQQLSVGAELDLGDYGAVGVSAWFEWFSGQQATAFGDTEATNDLQEVDYTVYWGMDIPNLPLSVETGWLAYTFPHVLGDGHYTNEWYISLAFDDSVLFGTESSVLNPYAAWYVDVDDVDGCWVELGISHDFPLAALGLAGTPFLGDLTVTPSAVLGIDKNQFDTGTNVHNILYGMAVSYDLGTALGIPEQYGSLTLTGTLNFSQAINDDVISDEFFGGITLGWGW